MSVGELYEIKEVFLVPVLRIPIPRLLGFRENGQGTSGSVASVVEVPVVPSLSL